MTLSESRTLRKLGNYALISFNFRNQRLKYVLISIFDEFVSYNCCFIDSIRIFLSL